MYSSKDFFVVYGEKKLFFFTKFDMLLIITCINIWGRYSEALQDKHRLTFLTITESGAAVQRVFTVNHWSRLMSSPTKTEEPKIHKPAKYCWTRGTTEHSTPMSKCIQL